MSALQLEDIQGLTVRAHAGLSRAVFVLLHVRDKKAAGKWLTSLADSVSCGPMPFMTRLARMAWVKV